MNIIKIKKLKEFEFTNFPKELAPKHYYEIYILGIKVLTIPMTYEGTPNR